MGRCDEQVFIYAGLFLFCSLVSALGGSALGLLLFFLSALAATLLLPYRRHHRFQLRELLSCRDH